MEEKQKFAVLEKDYYKNGYHCIIVFTHLGVRNGYIGIPKSNKMYGLKYDEETPLLQLNESIKFNNNFMGLFSYLCCKNTEDKSIPPSLYFSAHCGLNYSDFLQRNGDYNENKDLWYFGFDCGHCGDKPDYKRAYELGLIDKSNLECELKIQSKYLPDDRVHRSLEYVENCLNKLADEFKEFENNKVDT